MSTDFSIHLATPQSSEKLATALAAAAGAVGVDPTDAIVSATISAAVLLAEDLDGPVTVSIYGQGTSLRVHVDASQKQEE